MDHAVRMGAGRLYSPLDEGLTAERTRARGLTRRYNATLETELEARAAILAELFGTIGPDSEIEPPFYCDYGTNIHAGTCFYANFGCVILDCAEVRFGNDVLLAPYVQLFTAWHPTQPEVRASKLEYASPITIGHNVWLGGGTIVCPGVNIGDNTSIGAGSVVTKDIPSDVVAAGNPCRVIRPAR